MAVFKQRPVTFASGGGASDGIRKADRVIHLTASGSRVQFGIREANFAILKHMERLDSTVTSRRAEDLSKVFPYLPRLSGLSGWRLKREIKNSLERELKSQKLATMRKIAD
ncbi:MAG: hypothetical protein NT157_03090 [Candidatus Micrarchaeota archaeon]|nr:hypothetical protein [Candidatus Micrarchaeota archaeon]